MYNCFRLSTLILIVALDSATAGNCNKRDILDNYLQKLTVDKPGKISLGLDSLERNYPDSELIAFTGDDPVYRGDLIEGDLLKKYLNEGIYPNGFELLDQPNWRDLDFTIGQHLQDPDYTVFKSTTKESGTAANYANYNSEDYGKFKVVFQISYPKKSRNKLIDINATSEKYVETHNPKDTDNVPSEIGNHSDYEVLTIGRIPPEYIDGFYWKFVNTQSESIDVDASSFISRKTFVSDPEQALKEMKKK